MAEKSATGITFKQAIGIKNVFVNDWKIHFYTDAKKKIACIPFIRNLIEFTRGETDPDFVKLTSLLHWKSDSVTITVQDLDVIYNKTFAMMNHSTDQTRLVTDLISEQAEACMTAGDGINFENKIVLSVAIRLRAEKFMVDKLADPTFTNSITANQSQSLLTEFAKRFKSEMDNIQVLQRVVLITPENIHLNSFMYEPILDMSDEHLRKLYKSVVALT